MLAASNGHKNIVENLIDAGADVNVKNDVKKFSSLTMLCLIPS